MKLASKSKFFTGITILILFIMSYFIKIKVESDYNSETWARLLGILILHNPILLTIYALILAILIITGVKRIKFI